MNNLGIFLIAIPAVVMYSITIYMKNIHEGIPRERAVTISCTHGVLATGFFALVFMVKFAAAFS